MTHHTNLGIDAALEGELYRLIVQNSDDYAIFAIDRSGRILTWNRGAEKILGYTPSEAIGRPADCIFTAEDLAEGVPQREAALAMATGRADDNRWHVRRDGSRFWASGVLMRLGDDPANPLALAKILRDQTALKLAQEERDQTAEALRSSEQRFRRLIEANVLGVGISNAAGSWLDANDELLRILGRSREELRAGRVRWDAMTPPEHRPLDDHAIAEADQRGACSAYEKEYVRPDGTRVPVLSGFATVSGIRGHYVCFVLDLTPQKRIENELRQADRRKDEFLAMLAHELRNPLAPIRSGLDLLAMSGVDAEVVGPMQTQVEYLVRLVDDLLDVSRIMRGKVELRKEPVELAATIARAVEMALPIIQAGGHQFSQLLPDEPILLDADPVRLSQVVANLLNNAAKYTEPGGRIALQAHREGNELCIEVADSGVGIDADLLPRVFDLFTQASQAMDRSKGGLGIGLTVVKNLVEMHGGSVTAASDGPGRGSRFTVRLPILGVGSGLRLAEDPLTPTPDYRILIVDDNVAAAKMLSRLLAKLGGHTVFTAHDGAEAIEAASRHRPDLILLDIGLPKLDGYQVAGHLRRSADTSGVLLTALTGYGAADDRRRSLEAGFDEHMVKPPSLSALRKLLIHPKLASSRADGMLADGGGDGDGDETV